MNFIEVARKFIELDTTPSNGTLELATHAAELCRAAGFFVDLQVENLNGVDQANVIVRPVAAQPPDELLLQTHLDTCDPGNYASWTRTGANPYNATIYQNTLYGLGAANAKLDFLCKLRAAIELGPRPWKKPWVLVGTFGEELGMHGAIKLIRKKKISAKMALVGEPTDMALIHAGKGFAGVEIEIPFSQEEKDFRAKHDLGDGMTTQSRIFVGKASHSTSPEAGDSAILKMLDYLAKLPQGLAIMEIEGGISFNTIPAHAVLEIDMVGGLRETICEKIKRIMRSIADVQAKFRDYHDPEFDPPEPTLNVGLFRTHEEYVKLSGCVRLPPSVSHEIYEHWMQALRQTCQSVGAVFRVTDYKQPFRTPVDEPLLRICQEELAKLGRQSHCGAQSVANEANVFSRFGIACVVMGPGRGVGNSHAPNEHVKIEDLDQATAFYKSVIERICL